MRPPRVQLAADLDAAIRALRVAYRRCRSFETVLGTFKAPIEAIGKQLDGLHDEVAGTDLSE